MFICFYICEGRSLFKTIDNGFILNSAKRQFWFPLLWSWCMTLASNLSFSSSECLSLLSIWISCTDWERGHKNISQSSHINISSPKQFLWMAFAPQHWQKINENVLSLVNGSYVRPRQHMHFSAEQLGPTAYCCNES